VFVVCDPSLLGEGIEGLLRQEPGLEIVGRGADARQVLNRVRETRPDLIILTDGEAATRLEGELLCLVREGFRMGIVEIHTESNTLCIYYGEQRCVKEAHDLVDTLLHIGDGLTREE
jgi:chemotaxis response regulator CheB